MLLLPYPVLDPIAFTIGPIAIRWYGISYVAGIIMAWGYCLSLVRRFSLSIHPKDLHDLLPLVTLGIVVGGRLGHALFYQGSYYSHHPFEIFYIWRPGMSFHGGFLGVVFVLIVFCRRRKISYWQIGDLLGAAAPIGLFFGRLANFINGELFGRITSVPWAMVFPEGGPSPRHPSQLYEAGLEGLLLFIILFLMIYLTPILKRFPGGIASSFFLGYGFFRCFAELYREPEPGFGVWIGGTTWGQWLSLPMILTGILLWIWVIQGKTEILLNTAPKQIPQKADSEKSLSKSNVS